MGIMENLGHVGYVLALCIPAFGSAMGTYVAGMGALGAWKKCFFEKKRPPFILIAFVGAPLSQTIYGMILMNALAASPESIASVIKLSAGTMGGLVMGASAWLQGKAGAMASDVLGETQQGFGNYLMVLGIIETVALFVMVFLMIIVR